MMFSHAQGSRISHMCRSALVSSIFSVSSFWMCLLCSGTFDCSELDSMHFLWVLIWEIIEFTSWRHTLSSCKTEMSPCSNICLQKHCSSEQNVRVIVGDASECSAENTWWCCRMWENCRFLSLGRQFCLFCLFAYLFCLFTEDTHSNAARNGSVAASWVVLLDTNKISGFNLLRICEVLWLFQIQSQTTKYMIT